MAFSATLALPLGAWRVGSISNPLLQLDSKTLEHCLDCIELVLLLIHLASIVVHNF